MRSAGLIAAALMLLAPAALRAQIDRRVDRTTYWVHADVADQIDELDLEAYLREASVLLQREQSAVDVACCASLEASQLRIFGVPGDGLDVIDTEAEWGQIGPRKVIVQAIRWCGEARPNVLGCAQTPGAKLAVALDADPEDLAVILAHERGHNAGLPHRSDQQCALMNAGVAPWHGCLAVDECAAFRGLGAGLAIGQCDCLGPVVGDPTRPNGSLCTEGPVFGSCHSSGICSSAPQNDRCGDALALPAEGARLDEAFLASADGGDVCRPSAPDLWYSYRAPCSGTIELDACVTSFDSVLSVHEECGGPASAELSCNDNCGATIPGCRGTGPCVSAPVTFGEDLLLRVASRSAVSGPFVLRFACAEDASLDSDGDGLEDALEYGEVGTDPSVADTDGDGLGDGEEWLHVGSDPLDPDTDGDAVDDGSEVVDLGSNPLDPDTDGDRVLDGLDNCVLVTNATQSDVGGPPAPGDPGGSSPDGVGDACQCGDVNGDGRVGPADASAYRRELAQANDGAFVALKCRVWLGTSSCDVAQLAVLSRAVQGESAPGIAQVCAAASPS